MPLQKVSFTNNVPVELALLHSAGKICESRFGKAEVFYSLTQPPSACMYLNMSVSQKINALGPKPGERFVICKRSNQVWDVWLSQAAEAARAAQEAGVAVKPNGRPAWGGNPSPPTWDECAAKEPPSLLERQLAASISEAQAKKAAGTAAALTGAPVAALRPIPNPANGNGSSPALPPAGPQTRLEDALKVPVTLPPARPQTRLENALKVAVAAAYAASEYAKTIGYAAMPQFTSEDLRTMANTLIIDAQRRQ
jgi:hypothetical protein